MENNRKIVLVVGAAAVILALIIYIALLPEEPTVDPYVVQLEQEVTQYTAQIDSMNLVVDNLNSRIDVVRTQMDSARASNKVLLASLHRVTNQMKEYQRLYKEQRSLNDKLVTELNQVKSEKEKATVQVKQLKTEVDSLNNQMYEQTIRLTRMESSLEEALDREKTLAETVTSVLVYTGTEDDLKQKGYLKTWRQALFSKNYKSTGFPDVTTASNTEVLRIALGETLALQGDLAALCDRHGKLGKGKEYELSKGPPGQTLITFTDDTLMGQRILAVLKKK